MFAQRALISLTLGPLALGLIYLGGPYYFVPLAVILCLATIEYSRMLTRIGWHVPLWLLLLVTAVQWVLGQWPSEQWSGPALVISLLLILAYVLWAYETQSSNTVPADWMGMMAGLLLLGWMGGHFFRLRGIPTMAWQWTMLAMLSTWIADSGAYVVGKFLAGKFVLGKHQLSPRLSPNKTVEGYVGGILLGTGFTLLLAVLLKIPFAAALTLGLVVSIFGTLGDLGISLLKREAGMKDSGNLFPGHGGALDRIDTLLWSVTIAYYLAWLLL